MAQNAHLLNNMGLNPDTLELAKSIMHEAIVKTKPGSGYDLRHRATGLPAICAYIASHRLKTNEMTRHTAQVASCLSRPDFDKAFQTIEAAIGGSRHREAKFASYQSLCRKYEANEHVLDPLFQQAQRALLIIDRRYNPDRMAEVKYGIFYWVCSLWKGKIQEIEEFAATNKLSYKTFVAVVTTLNDKCKSLKAEIINSGKKTAASPIKSTPTPTRRSLTKQPLRELPTKDSPTKKRAISPDLPKQSSQPTHKVLTDLDRRPFPETPSKRRKLDESARSSHQTPAVSATPLKSILRTSPHKASATSTSSRVKLAFSRPEAELSDSDADMDTTGPLPPLNLAPKKSQAEDESEADSVEDESDVDGTMGDASPFLSRRNKRQTLSATVTATIRRFRPVYLDYKQWNTLDPRLSAIYAT